MSSHRRRSFVRPNNINLLRLEERLAPAISIMGPHTMAEAIRLGDTAATSWSVLGQPPVKGDHTPAIVAPNSLYFQLDSDLLMDKLGDAPQEFTANYNSGSFIVMLPRPDGSFQEFRVWEMSLMEPGLAAQYPDWHTYRGQGVDDPTAVLAADITSAGFHVQVLTPNGAYYIDPYFRLESTAYISYYKSNLVNDNVFTCPLHGDLEAHDDHDVISSVNVGPGGVRTTNGTTLRTYRTAVAATGEYTAFFGGTVTAGQAAIVTSINRVSGVYELELAVRLTLIANNNLLVYTNAGADPYTNGDGGKMLGENQSNIDGVIGSANYDLGHVFSTGGGGVAGLGVVTIAGQKAQGVTGSGSPVGDAFDIDYVAHEMGHQFDGDHTFNGSIGGRVSSSAYEPGSASTIMGYAGITGSNDLQSNSDAYFHARSLDQIVNFIVANPGTNTTATGNTIPTVNAGVDRNIPASTPFELTGAGTDANGDAITYNWEEFDLGVAQNLPLTDNGTSPIQRSFKASTNPVRTLPRLSNLLNNTLATGEILPTTNRTLNYRLTVRDNRANGGGIATDDMKITVVNTGAAFAVTAPNTAVSWSGGSSQSVTWNVAGTTAGGINATNVTILLSTDGGNTFPNTIVASTANDGSELIIVPNLPTGSARIKVQPVGNIFFDISNVNFTITPSSGFNVTSASPASGTIVTAPFTTLDLTFAADVNPGSIGTDDLVLSKGTVTGANLQSTNVVRYTLSGLTAETAVNVTLPSGAVQNLSSTGNDAFAASYNVDVDTGSITTPLVATSAGGILSYTGLTTGTVNTTSDTDAFTLSLDADQSVSVQLLPSAGLRATLTLTGPGGVNQTASSSANGAAASLTSVATPTAGLYTFTVGGLASTIGAYSFRVDVNTDREGESNGGATNETTGTAQAIAGAYALGGGATRSGVRGRIVNTSAAIASETEPNNSTAESNDGRYDFATVSTNLYQMSLTGTLSSAADTDYFNLGQLQAGDILTITESGSGSARGTLADPLVQLYSTASGATTITENDDAGYPTFLDSLIHRFTITSTDTYYVRANNFNTATGTYQLAVYLENASTAPTTGGVVVSETEANDSVATANNASTSWRAVNYRSTITGTAADSDYFRYQLNAGDVVTARITSGGGLDARLNIRNSAGTIVAAEIGASTALGANSNVYAYRATVTGLFYVEVLPNSGTGTYTLNVDLSSATTPLTPVADVDLYSFAVTANEPLAIGGRSLTGGNIDLELLDAGGAPVATGALGATNYDETIAFTPLASGTWFVRVSGADATDYIVSLTRNAAQDTEANDSFATAQSLINNRTVGAISGNDDWYTVALTPGQVITLTTTTPGGGTGEFVNALDPVIELYDPSNTIVGSDDNSAGDGINSKLTKAASAAGNYRVHVSGVGGSNGEYTLAASISSAAPPTISGTPVVDDGNPQRSRVRSLTVTFSTVVTLPAIPADAFQVARTGPGGTLGNALLAVDTSASTPTQTIATLTFSGFFTEGTSLIDGRYTMSVFSSQVTDSFGQALDGDGNGSAGPDYTFDLFRFFGDIDGDATVAANDFIQFRLALGGSNPYFDIDNDGAVAASDFIQFRLRFGGSI